MNDLIRADRNTSVLPAVQEWQPQTLLSLLDERARTLGSAAFLHHVGANGTDETVSFAGLRESALRLAGPMRDRTSLGSRVLLGVTSIRQFVEVFFGLLYAGCIPVPIATPKVKSPVRPVQAILRACGARTVIVDEAVASAWCERELGALDNALVLHPGQLPQGPSNPQDHEARHDDIAFLQFTSGSTGSPKGVMVSHGNLLHNQALIKECFGHSESTIFAGWLPLYHDMGLIGNVLQPLYLGVPTVLLSPMAFLERPARLLQAITRFRATTCGMPNFGYAHCVDRVRDAELDGLDLSSWQVAFNGAEPVRERTLHAFSARFMPVGFRRQSFYPCYGLAEATLFVTGGAPGELWHSVADETAAGRNIVSAGFLNAVQEVRIVDSATCEPCQEGDTGEVWISGPCVGQGYWALPRESEETFHAQTADCSGPWMRTGDLGFVQDKQLFITGRLKDLIIVRGKNHYPQDIEGSVEACSPDFLPGGTAAFMVDPNEDDRIVVVQEIRRNAIRSGDRAHWTLLVKDVVAKAHQIQVADVRFVLPSAIPRTSSGKIQRSKCRAMYLEKKLQLIHSFLADAVTP